MTLKSRAANRGIVAVLGIYLAGRVWQLVTMGPPMTAPDSPMYRSDGQSWLDFNAVSWDGYSLRPWPVTGFFALLPSDSTRVIAQFVLATIAWITCIYQVGRLPVRPGLAVTAAGAVALLALTQGVTTFDVFILSESIALSLVAFFLAALLRASRVGPGPGSLATMLLTAWMLSLIRPVLLGLLLVPVVVVVAKYGSWDPRRWKFEPRRLARAAAVVLPVLLLSIVAMLNVVSYNSVSDKAWGDWRGQYGLNGRTIQQWNIIAGASPVFPQLLEQFVTTDGAPACLDDSYQQPPPADPVPLCDAGLQWISGQFNGTLVKELAEHPNLARRYFIAGAQDMGVQRPDGAPSLSTLIPEPIAGLAFNSSKGTDIIAFWTLLAAVALVTVLVLRRRGVVKSGLVAALLAGYIGLIGTVLLSPLDVSRVGLPVTVLIRVLIIVLVVLVVDALRRIPAPARPVGPPPDEKIDLPTDTQLRDAPEKDAGAAADEHHPVNQRLAVDESTAANGRRETAVQSPSSKP